jgi:hypothetical protein
MSYRSLGSDEVTLRNYRPVGRRKGNMSLSDPPAAGVVHLFSFIDGARMLRRVHRSVMIIGEPLLVVGERREAPFLLLKFTHFVGRVSGSGQVGEFSRFGTILVGGGHVSLSVTRPAPDRQCAVGSARTIEGSAAVKDMRLPTEAASPLSGIVLEGGFSMGSFCPWDDFADGKAAGLQIKWGASGISQENRHKS